MVDSVYDTSLKYDISFAKEKTSKDNGRFKSESEADQKMEYCSSVGFELSMFGLLFDAYLVSKVVKAHDFMPDLKVGRYMPVVNDAMNLLFHRQRTLSLVKT